MGGPSRAVNNPPIYTPFPFSLAIHILFFENWRLLSERSNPCPLCCGAIALIGLALAVDEKHPRPKSHPTNPAVRMSATAFAMTEANSTPAGTAVRETSFTSILTTVNSPMVDPTVTGDDMVNAMHIPTNPMIALPGPNEQTIPFTPPAVHRAALYPLSRRNIFGRGTVARDV